MKMGYRNIAPTVFMITLVSKVPVLNLNRVRKIIGK